ncbi:MAG: hypothetical protein ACK40S_07330 [Burkholderiaceae bacterium]
MTSTTKRGVQIGCRYTGKHQFCVTSDGVYWEALPPIDGSMLRVQQGLLAKPKAPRKPRVTATFKFSERLRLGAPSKLPTVKGVQ